MEPCLPPARAEGTGRSSSHASKVLPPLRDALLVSSSGEGAESGPKSERPPEFQSVRGGCCEMQALLDRYSFDILAVGRLMGFDLLLDLVGGFYCVHRWVQSWQCFVFS